MVYKKVTHLVKKTQKEKKSNRKFQETMLQELDSLSKALKDKKKKRGNHAPAIITKRPVKQQVIAINEEAAQKQSRSSLKPGEPTNPNSQVYFSKYG